LEKKASLLRSHALSQPDPVLGYPTGKDSLWSNSLLKSVLLDRQEVWGETVKVVSGETSARTTGGGEGEEVLLEGKSYVPKHFNFGLTEEQAHQLVEVLPAVSSIRSLGEGLSTTAVVQQRVEKAEKLEGEKRDKLMRIVDLRNAGSKGIEVENTRRIVKAFGTTEGDTGSPEVQGAFSRGGEAMFSASCPRSSSTLSPDAT
jgi:small subunit ribosomal protein S15